MARRNHPALDAVFHALAHTTRRRILERLARGDRRVTDLARPHAVSLPAISRHIRVLERAGLVRRQRLGSEHVIQLRTPRLHQAARWMAFHERGWSAQLEALEELVSGR